MNLRSRFQRRIVKSDKKIGIETVDNSLEWRASPTIPRFPRWFMSNPALSLVVVFIVMLLYQAALPAGLTLNAEARDVSWNIISTASFHISKASIIGNVVPYFIFGHFVFLAFWRRQPFYGRAAVIAIVATVGITIAVELLQLFNLYRTTDIWDVLCGVIGGVSGGISGALYVKFFSQRISGWFKREVRLNPLFVAAILLAVVICWDAARPFYFISSANKLIENIKHSILVPFEPPGRDIREQLGLKIASGPKPEIFSESALDFWGSIGERLITCTILFSLLFYGDMRRGGRHYLKLYLFVLLLVELLNLGVVNGRFDITRVVVGIIAIPLAILAVRVCLHRPGMGARMMLAAFLANIFISDLRPYIFGKMARPSLDALIPLIHHVRSEDVMMLANIVESSVVYAPVGMLLYLRSLPRPLGQLVRWPSSLSVCMVCGLVSTAVELIQMWLPARTSSLEDVIFAVIGAYVGVSAARFYAYSLTLQTSGCELPS